MVQRGRRVFGWAIETVPGRVVRRFGSDGVTFQATLVAWNLLLSFFPIVLALAGILGLVLGHAGLATRARIESVAFSQLPNVGDARVALDAVQARSGVFFFVGLAGMLWTGSNLFGAVEQAFDAIYSVKPRGFVPQKLISVLMMFLFAAVGVLILVSSSALALLQSLPFVPSAVLSAGPAVGVVQGLFAICAGCLLFGVVYFVMPNRRMRVGEVWPGALLAGVGFYALSLLFPTYVTLSGGMNQYGKGLSVLFVFMAWAYFAGLIIMVGAELNAVLGEGPGRQ